MCFANCNPYSNLINSYILQYDVNEQLNNNKVCKIQKYPITMRNYERVLYATTYSRNIISKPLRTKFRHYYFQSTLTQKSYDMTNMLSLSKGVHVVFHLLPHRPQLAKRQLDISKNTFNTLQKHTRKKGLEKL